VYDSSNVGYIQLGLDTVKHIVSLADTTYNVGYISTLSTTFSLPSGYGAAIASNYASIKMVAESVEAHFLVDDVLIKSQALTVGTDGKVATGTGTTRISLSGLNIWKSINSSLSIDVYVKKAKYIDYVYASFNSYNYSLSVSNISGLTNTTTDVSNGTSSFYGDGIEKTKTARFTYTLTYFTFSDGNYFTNYGIKSISETKSYSSNDGTSTLEWVSSVGVATLSATMDMWCEYNSDTGMLANHDGKFYHKWKLSKSLSSPWSVTASITAYGKLQSYYINQTNTGYIPDPDNPGSYIEVPYYDIFAPITEKDITVSTMDDDVTGSKEYQLGLSRTHLAMDNHFTPEYAEVDLIEAYSFTINNSDVTTIVNNGIANVFS